VKMGAPAVAPQHLRQQRDALVHKCRAEPAAHVDVARLVRRALRYGPHVLWPRHPPQLAVVQHLARRHTV